MVVVVDGAANSRRSDSSVRGAVIIDDDEGKWTATRLPEGLLG